MSTVSQAVPRVMSDGEFSAWKRSMAARLGRPLDDDEQARVATARANVLDDLERAGVRGGELWDQVRQAESDARDQVVAERDGYLPTLEEDAEATGYQLGITGHDASPPAGWSFARLVAFFGGFLKGREDREQAERELNAWLDERDAERLAEIMAGDFSCPEDVGCC